MILKAIAPWHFNIKGTKDYMTIIKVHDRNLPRTAAIRWRLLETRARTDYRLIHTYRLRLLLRLRCIWLPLFSMAVLTQAMPNCNKLRRKTWLKETQAQGVNGPWSLWVEFHLSESDIVQNGNCYILWHDFPFNRIQAKIQLTQLHSIALFIIIKLTSQDILGWPTISLPLNFQALWSDGEIGLVCLWFLTDWQCFLDAH